MPFAPSSILVTGSHLLLVRPGATKYSVLAPSSDARSLKAEKMPG